VELKNWLNIITIVLMFLYLGVGVSAVVWVKSVKTKRFEYFKTTLTRGIDTKKITTLKDCVDVVKGITGTLEEDGAKSILAAWLPRYLVRLISEQVTFTQPVKSNDAKEIVSGFIRELEVSDPFAQLPSAERGVINDIHRAVESDNKMLAEAKIKDLASLVEARIEDQNKIQRINKYSTPLAIVGVILTVLFGIISLIK
jgi:hypothetical protein